MKKFLIVGLGNIGLDYVETRHNIGFKIVEAFVKQHEANFEEARYGALANFKFKGRSIHCIKPNTFMNRSGRVVKYWMAKEKIPLENILIVTDDIHLPYGTLRLKAKGSDGGHNGLKDIQQELGTTKYHRLRFGVGADFQEGRQVDYVLGQWNGTELQKMGERLDKTSQMLGSFVFNGANQTMNRFNGT